MDAKQTTPTRLVCVEITITLYVGYIFVFLSVTVVKDKSILKVHFMLFLPIDRAFKKREENKRDRIMDNGTSGGLHSAREGGGVRLWAIDIYKPQLTDCIYVLYSLYV